MLFRHLGCSPILLSNRAQSQSSYMSFRLWEAHEPRPSESQAFVLLLAQRRNRNPAHGALFGCGAARPTRRNKTRDKCTSGKLRARCAPLQRVEFPQLPNGERQAVRGVRQLLANTRKAE